MKRFWPSVSHLRGPRVCAWPRATALPPLLRVPLTRTRVGERVISLSANKDSSTPGVN